GAQLLGSDSSDTFTIVGAGDINYQQANIGDVVNFTGISTVNAGSGSDQVNAAANTDWQLNSNNALSAQGVNFTGVEKASATTSRLLATTGNDSFRLSEVGSVSVAGIVFDGLDNIDGNGGTDNVDGNGAVWSASSAEAAKAIAVMSGISVIFTDIDAVLNTGNFAGVDINSTYNFSDINTMSYTGITFSGVRQLDAGSATGELQGGDLDSTWILGDGRGRVSSSGNSLGFSGIENITSGGGVDNFIVSSGAINNIDTGAGEDFVNLDGGLVNSLNTGAGDDVVELNNVASASVSLQGGSGTDRLLVNIDNIEWSVTGPVSATNYVSGTAFSEFEDLTNSSTNLDLDTSLTTTFNSDNVSFNDGSMTLSYNSNGDILLDSQATGANSITGTVVANRLDISASGDIDLDTEIVELKVANNGSSINVDVSAKKDLVIEQVDAGAAGNIVLTSKNLGALTFKTLLEIHLIANTVNLGTESERLESMGEINNQLRANVLTSVDIVAVSFVTPDFFNQQPSVSATGDKLQSFTSAKTYQGLQSIKDTVEELTQINQAILNEVSPYSIGVDALYNPEMRLIDGVLLPIEATAADDEYDDYSNLQNFPLKPAS
ncbi:autotransporter outer membrane beta-barrel domain-containing protein, partial [Paraglaciecola psychrophila]